MTFSLDKSRGFLGDRHTLRRMRFGAFMNGPDYVQWHGIYEQLIDLTELKEWNTELRSKGFSPLAALSAVLILIKPKPGWTMLLNNAINFIGIVTGILGFGFHLQGSSAGNVVSFSGLTSGNPVFAPLAFVALGSIGLLTTLDDQPNSRTYHLTQKTRWLLLATAFWFLVTALVAYFDHARTGFTNLYTWIPFYMGIFAAMILLFQAYSDPEHRLSILLGTTVLLSFTVGLLGFAFHLSADLAGRGSILWSRIFYQAPGLAPPPILRFRYLGSSGLFRSLKRTPPLEQLSGVCLYLKPKNLNPSELASEGFN